MNQVTIIGAGIVGICTAVTLQQRGIPVRLIDEREPGTGTSYGNAGLLSVDSCMPIAMPGMIKKIPKWLSDREGPLSVRPAYLSTAAPWLLKWLKAGFSESGVRRLSSALRALHRDADQLYLQLLGPKEFAQAFHMTGQLHIWESEQDNDALGRQIRADNGVTPRTLNAQEIQDLLPHISRKVKRGELYEKNGHASNPYQLVQSLFQLFLKNGGQFIRQKVNGISRDGATGQYRIILAAQDLSASRLVVCAGAWAKRVLSGLHVAVPLETERGYHVCFQPDALQLSIPVLHKERAFGVTPMVDNLRVAGFVEIAGLDAPPDMAREKVLLQQAKMLFPDLDLEKKKDFWLGFRPSTPDSLPILGTVDKLPELYLGFGHGHTGITGAPKSAQILANLITNTPNDVDITPYGLDRF